MLDYFANFFELFAFLSCAYAYKKLDSNFKMFLPFLTFVIVYEFINAFFLNLVLRHHSNAWCNNLESLLEFLVYGRFMASLDKRKAYKRKVYITVAAGIIITFVDIFFIHGFWMLGTVAIIIQNMIRAVLVFNYYYSLVNSLDDYPDLISYPPFLATTGLVVYSLVNCFYFITFDYLVYRKNYTFPMTVYIIHELSCVFLYSLLGVSFLCFLRPKKLA